MAKQVKFTAWELETMKKGVARLASTITEGPITKSEKNKLIDRHRALVKKLEAIEPDDELEP